MFPLPFFSYFHMLFLHMLIIDLFIYFYVCQLAAILKFAKTLLDVQFLVK